MVSDIDIEDDVANAGEIAVEVSLTLDGVRRWCFFMTPAALANAGDFVPGTSVRYHAGAEHMVVVSALSEEMIQQVIQHLDRSGTLASCTRPFADGPS